MYGMVARLARSELWQQELPAMASSLAIAEMFYKFHSFLLEAIAFLATWYVIGLCLNLFRRAFLRED